MPYIAIKAFPKDEEVVKDLIEKVNQALIDAVGCPPEVVSISYEEIQPQDWEERIINGEMAANAPFMKIRDGQRL